MIPKIKTPVIMNVGGRIKVHLDTSNPLDQDTFEWMIDGDLDKAIKKSQKSFKKLHEKHREIALHEIKDINVYTKHNGEYVKYKPVKL